MCRNKIYSNSIFNYIKIERGRWKNVRLKKENGELGVSQGLMSIQVIQRQVSVTEIKL
jgi:hypothetical protein